MDYGIIIPSYIYKRLEDFLKDKPEIVKTVVGVLIGIPLVIADLILSLATPVLVLFILMYVANFLTQKIIFFLYSIIMIGLNRYTVLRNRAPILMAWQGFFIIISIHLTFWAHGGSLPIFTGILFIATTVSNGIVNGMSMYNYHRGIYSKKLDIARKITELMFFIMATFLSVHITY